jgi:predicted ArsR family transcriptional regulator
MLGDRPDMDIPPPTTRNDALAAPLAAGLFQALADLCRPATTQELAQRVGRHHNTVRGHLQRLADAGLLERRTTRQVRGRPRDMWAIAADAMPGGEPPDAHRQLSVWLTRALSRRDDLDEVQSTGRDIGRALAGEATVDTAAERRMQDALTALGFAPRRERTGPRDLRFVLRNCPYRSAVLQNAPVVCTLHRGITEGLLERFAPDAWMAGFVARDPVQAGCLIELADLPVHSN